MANKNNTAVVTAQTIATMSVAELNDFIATSDDKQFIAMAEARLAELEKPATKARSKEFVTIEVTDVQKHSQYDLMLVTGETPEGESIIISYGSGANAPYGKVKHLLQPACGYFVVAEVEKAVANKTHWTNKDGSFGGVDTKDFVAGTFNVKRESNSAMQRRMLERAEQKLDSVDVERAMAFATLYGNMLRK